MKPRAAVDEPVGRRRWRRPTDAGSSGNGDAAPGVSDAPNSGGLLVLTFWMKPDASAFAPLGATARRVNSASVWSSGGVGPGIDEQRRPEGVARQAADQGPVAVMANRIVELLTERDPGVAGEVGVDVHVRRAGALAAGR